MYKNFTITEIINEIFRKQRSKRKGEFNDSNRPLHSDHILAETARQSVAHNRAYS